MIRGVDGCKIHNTCMTRNMCISNLNFSLHVFYTVNNLPLFDYGKKQ